ncbi:ferredoxin [Candidatus Woesearchaeota archaeon]|nr:ferredoxin [Candidatus Woesearchaeota archaeon]
MSETCTVEHDKPACIGCGSCAALVPEHWEMEAEGKSHLKESAKDGEKELLENAPRAKNQEAAEVCPVNCIHIIVDGNKVL